MHKPLYSALKSKGFVRANNKIFSLTSSGIDAAAQLQEVTIGKKQKGDSRFTRSSLVEINRMKKTEGLQLFIEGKANGDR